MAIVVLKCPKTGEIVCTPYPENGYEDWEVMAIDREPREGERWGENGWEHADGELRSCCCRSAADVSPTCGRMSSGNVAR